MSVVTIGETMAALSPDHIGPLRHARSLGMSIAGSESNVAIGLCRLGHGAAWIGRVGDDELGDLVEMRLRGEGVAVHAARDPAAPTGLMIKEQRLAGMRRVHYYRRDSAGSRLDISDIPDGVIETAAVLHLSGITFAVGPSADATARAAVGRARENAVTVSLDLNHRRRLWSDAEAVAALSPLLSDVDILFASEDEARLFEPDADSIEELAVALRGRGPDVVVITLGEDGAVGASARNLLRIAAFPVREVDPVGAGDAFVAGYLSGFLHGEGEPERLRRASAVAALSVATQGDWEGLPGVDELELVERCGDMAR